MKRLRAWLVRLAGLWPAARRERELADEIESHPVSYTHLDVYKRQTIH